MRPTRSTEELKRANSFKGFINKKDEDEISLNHEDEDGIFSILKYFNRQMGLKDEERILFRLIMILGFTKGCDFNSLLTGGEERRHFSKETSLKK